MPRNNTGDWNRITFKTEFESKGLHLKRIPADSDIISDEELLQRQRERTTCPRCGTQVLMRNLNKHLKDRCRGASTSRTHLQDQVPIALRLAAAVREHWAKARTCEITKAFVAQHRNMELGHELRTILASMPVDADCLLQVIDDSGDRRFAFYMLGMISGGELNMTSRDLRVRMQKSLNTFCGTLSRSRP